MVMIAGLQKLVHQHLQFILHVAIVRHVQKHLHVQVDHPHDPPAAAHDEDQQQGLQGQERANQGTTYHGKCLRQSCGIKRFNLKDNWKQYARNKMLLCVNNFQE